MAFLDWIKEILAAVAAWSSGLGGTVPPGPDAPPSVVRELSALAPDFREKLSGFLIDANAAGTALRVIETARTADRQAWLYAQGRTRPGAIVTNARPGTSRHELGRAADTWPVGLTFDDPSVSSRLVALAPLAKRWGLKNLSEDYGHWEDA